MGRSGLVSLPLARLEKTFKMVVKISLIASFAAVLIICATAELPTEENNVLDSEVGLDTINPVAGLEENTAEEEELRQKREAIPDQKKGKGKGNGKARNGKGKGKGKTRKGKGKKPRNGKGKGKGKKARKGKGKGKGKDINIKNGKNGKKSKNGNRKKTIKEKNGKGKGKGKNGGRNGKKSKKGRKTKEPKINGRRNKPKKIGGQSRQTTINLTCSRDAVTYTKFLKDNVVNFLRRNTRLAKQNKLTNNKAGKKGEFKEPAARLIQSGGGDRTNLSCSGSTTNVGAKKMLNATNTLDACEVSIKKACKPPAANETFLKLCGTNAVKFNTTVIACVTKATKGQDACSCFQASEVAAEKKVLESCKGTKEAAAAAKARTACLKVIQKCKTAATTAGVLQYACRFTTDEMLGTLKQLSLNSAAFKALLDKIKSLTGLEPQKPGSSSNRTSSGRRVRSAEEDEEEDARLRGKRQEQACSTIVTTITTCTTSITNTPALSTVVTKCKAPTFTISACTDDDKTNIQKALNDAIAKNAIILAFTDSVKSELAATTGSTPSNDQITGAGKPTNKAASRSRSMLRKMIMEKMQLKN